MTNTEIIRLKNTVTERDHFSGLESFLHIVLCVAAVNSQRVKFHQFTSVVLIDTSNRSRRFVVCSWVLTLQAGQPVVEVIEHRRRAGSRAQQIAKIAQRKRANRIAIKLSQ